MRAPPLSRGNLFFVLPQTPRSKHTITTRTEDKATLESDLSADPDAGIGAGAQLPPIRLEILLSILARKR